MASLKSLIQKSIILLVVFVTACSGMPIQPTATLTPQPEPTLTPTLRNPVVNVTRVPDPQTAATDFLTAWKNEDYAAMYGMLTRLSQDAITAEDFEKNYRDTAIKMTLQSIEPQILSAQTHPASAEVVYRIRYNMSLLAPLERDMTMRLTFDAGVWKVQWERALILPELQGENRLAMEYSIPARANIYDRNGNAIVAQTDAVALGLVPGEIVDSQEDLLLRKLSELTGKNPDSIKRLYKYALPDWYIAVGECSLEALNADYDTIANLGGIRISPFRARYYFDGGIAPQTVGYVLGISPEKLEEFQRKGYTGDERVGADGLEAWGEQYLAGTHGAALYVKDAQGQIITRLAKSEPSPARSITTTLDRDLQLKLQKSYGGYNGAAIVMEKDTGRILAIVSWPGFDPNLFEPSNLNSQLLQQVMSDPDQPLYNRATQGVYPLGSVFKVITFSAALASTLFLPEDQYECGYTFTDLGVTLYDWTYEKKLPASGVLTLPEGLMRSCNPWFWHIGLSLYQAGRPNAIAEMARAFGLNQVTGIEVPEQSGSIINPANEVDATQMAIGQGTVMVTPLQVVRFMAAVGNDGTLLRPQLIEKIESSDPNQAYTFKPEIQGTLPLSTETLMILQDAMISVVQNRRGTANFILGDMRIPIAGKTGTAQNATGKPHAWFAGYTYANNPKKPDIAVVVMLENAGEGSEMAAPIFRRIVSLYFSNNVDAGGTLPWESIPYVVKSPTPSVTDTPEPVIEETPTETPAP
ncbi:MAG TPA: penicillin-binding transpeptidase domain-containing protein [Anaerolineaceae bacterium]|nr:penicillin-binding transpeptidase domain-containing protein [Anaerolineaceae bacterium]HPN52238.1 penicillin-binding transpeptidase domain-containing protein [Anaerolineaceae bacterium]